MSRWRRFLLLVVVLSGAAAPLRAEVLDVARMPAGELNLWPAADVMVDGTATLGVAEVAVAGAFRPATGSSGNFGFTRGAVWVRFSVANSGDEKRHILLHVGRPNLDSIRLYRRAEGGGWSLLETGDHVPFPARPFAFHEPVFPVEVPPGGAESWYLRVASTSAVWITLSAQSESRFAHMAAAASLKHGLLFGLLGVLAFYNLVLFASIRDRGYLYYALLACAQTGFFLSLLGYANQYLWPQATWWADRATNVFAAAALFLGLLFLRHYLDTRRQVPHWDRLFLVKQLLALLLVPLALLGPFRLAASLVGLLAGVLAVTAVIVAAQLWWRGSRAGRWYFLSWVTYLSVLGYRVLELFGLVPLLLGDGAFEIAMALTMLLLSFALADQLNQMREEKEAAQAGEFRAQRRANERLENEVVARTRALVEATEAAQAASRAKSEFVAMVSHEIRNPLTAVIGNAQLLHHMPLAPEQRELVAAMEQGGAQVLALLNDFLDLTRIESGELKVERAAFSLPDVVVSVVEGSEALAAGKRVSLRYDNGRVPPWVYGDVRRVRQVLLNLVGNAVRFTDEGEIVVTLDLLDEEAERVTVCVTVSDTGIGIPSHKLDCLFQPFSQLHAGAREGGTGLGLAICKRLVAAMGGEIGVESTLGEGSAFWFTLDFERAPAPAAAPARAAPSPLSMLLVEDLPASRQIVSKLLRREGHRVTAVSSGEEAVAAVQHDHFDLVLMDLQMPGLGGYEAVRRIRALPGLDAGALPIFAFTANVLERTPEECRQAGFNGIVPKPLDLEFLNGHILKGVGGEGAASRRSAPAAGPIDIATLDGRLQLLGKKDMEEVIASYLESGAATLREIEAAESAGALGEVARLAHRLAGAADMVGLQGVAAPARRLETQLATDSAVETRTLVEGIRAAHHAGVEALLAWASSRGAAQSRVTGAAK